MLVVSQLKPNSSLLPSDCTLVESTSVGTLFKRGNRSAKFQRVRQKCFGATWCFLASLAREGFLFAQIRWETGLFVAFRVVSEWVSEWESVLPAFFTGSWSRYYCWWQHFKAFATYCNFQVNVSHIPDDDSLLDCKADPSKWIHNNLSNYEQG